MSLIKKIRILKDQIYFLPSQLIEIKGKITRKSKFWGKLGVKLKKFAAKNQYAKGAELWGPGRLKSGVKLKKLKV